MACWLGRQALVLQQQPEFHFKISRNVAEAIAKLPPGRTLLHDFVDPDPDQERHVYAYDGGDFGWEAGGTKLLAYAASKGILPK